MSGDFKHTDEFDTEDARYCATYLGEVVENLDPLSLGRVRVLVPGLLSPESKWAWPIGFMLGVKEGLFAVPRVGANVMVFLHQGEVDHPYYLPGPFGAPDQVSDVPEQAISVDHVTFRWGGFHVTFNSTPGKETLTVEDLDSGTLLQIDKQTGDYVRDVEGDEQISVKKDRSVTVEEGDETHEVLVGGRTTTIQGDDSETIVAGNKIETITAGDKTLDMAAGSETKTLLAGSSTESMPSGSKTVTAGVNVSITAGANVSILAGGAATVAASSISLNSGGGPTTFLSGGLVTKTFLGSVVETILGAMTVAITGVATWTFVGVANFLGAVINLGLGPIFKNVLNSALIDAFNAHTHTGVTPGGGVSGGPQTQITPGGSAPFRREDMESQNVFVS